MNYTCDVALVFCAICIFFVKQKTAYEMRISDWSSDVCSSDLLIDYDAVEKLAKECRPSIIITGGSAYPRHIDFARFRAIADEVGAYSMVDMEIGRASCRERVCQYV